jgi:hypothetical protein
MARAIWDSNTEGRTGLFSFKGQTPVDDRVGLANNVKAI